MAKPKEKLVKNVGEIKTQVKKITKDAKKTVDTVKQAVQVGIGTSKAVIQKAGETINKKQIGSGIATASKGVDIIAKGARIASKGAGSLASGLEKASQKIRDASTRLKQRD